MNHHTGAAEPSVAHFQGEVIRLGRWRRGLTQQELAAVTGLAQSTISRLEANKDRDPPCSAHMALATALNLWHVAFLPWGGVRHSSPHLATVHAVLSGCLANHFLHHRGNMLRCLHYCLRDAMCLRPDLCGLEVLLLGAEPVTRYGAMANRHAEIVTREDLVGAADDHHACVDHWTGGRPHWRSAGGSAAGGGFYEPAFLVDDPVEWGVVRWGFCAERQTESHEQTLHWIGAASRTLEMSVKAYLSGLGRQGEQLDLTARVARLEQLVTGQLPSDSPAAAAPA